MKLNTRTLRTAAALTAASAVLLISGCSKDNDGPAAGIPSDQAQEMSRPVTDKITQKRIDEVVETLPAVAVYNEAMDEYILLDLRQDKPKFDFASPDAGWSFSGPSGSMEFVQAPDGTWYQVVSPTGSSSMGGGTVTAGSIALDVNYVMCFNSGDDFFDLGFDVGTFSGFSGAVGIAGDFEALMEEEIDEDADPFAYFQGMVAYYAFSGQASGSYPVVDFFDVESEDVNPENKSIAFLFAFVDGGGIFFSKDGNVTFSGNSVAFDGTYFGITDFTLTFDDDVTDIEAQYVEVPGFGALTCQ